MPIMLVVLKYSQNTLYFVLSPHIRSIEHPFVSELCEIYIVRLFLPRDMYYLVDVYLFPVYK